MRNGLTQSAISAAALALLAGTASAQLSPDIAVDLTLAGTFGDNSTQTFTTIGQGVEGGDVDLYLRRGTTGLNGPYGTNEFVVAFTTTETMFFQLDVDELNFTGPGNPLDQRCWLIGRLETDIAALTVGNFPFVTAIDGLFNTDSTGINDQFGFGPYPPGTYYLSFDPFTGPIAGQTFGDGQVTANWTLTTTIDDNAPYLGNEMLTAVQVDANLGALNAGSFNLAGSTVGQDSDLVGYRGADLNFFGFLSELGEFTYQFSTGSQFSFALVNNEGIDVGSDQDHYLMNGDGVTTSFNLFGDGSTLGTVADATIAFLDESGNFGIFGAGTYFLAVESFDAPAINGVEGPYDVNLTLATTSTCGTGAFNVSELAGPQFNGGSLFFGDDTGFNPNAESNVCYYRNVDAGLVPTFTNEFNEYVIQFSTSEDLLFTLANLEGAGAGVDHDQWLLDGLDVTTDVLLTGLGVPGASPNGTAAENLLGLVDEEGTFGVRPAGLYWLSIDGFDGDGFASITLDFTAQTLLPDVIDVAGEATGNDLGPVGAAFTSIDFSACALTATDQDTIIGIWDAATGDLLFVGDDGCDTGNSFATEIENMIFAEGNYVLSIGGFQGGAFGDGLVHNTAFTADSVAGGFNFGVGALTGGGVTANFNVNAFSREVFTFSITPGTLTLPTFTDLGTLIPGEDLDFDISFCDSDYDVEVGVWDDLGQLIGAFDTSAVCAGYQPAFFFDLDPDGDGEVAAEAIGDQIYIGVGGFNTDFASNFQSVVDANDFDQTTRSGNIVADAEGTSFGGPSVANALTFFRFTVGSPAPTFPGCNAADLADERGVLNVNDIIDFVNAFNALDALADISPLDGIFPGGDGNFNVNDVIDFVNAFNGGCP